MSDEHAQIGIIGAGFAGAMLAVHLIEMSSGPIKILLFDKNASFAKGPAYATPNAKHLLNVRVANMSAYDGDPSHFVRWLEHDRQSQGDRTEGALESGSPFVSRGTYGRYLRATLEAACLSEKSGAHVIEVAAEVTDLHKSGRSITLISSDGRRFDVDCAALCVGNFPPAPPVGGQSLIDDGGRYIAVPWNVHSLDRIGPRDSVALIGTGLTMVDVVLELRSRGHEGHVTALSRHGFLPFPHRDVALHESFLPSNRLPRTVRQLVRRVRGEVASAARRGIDWRSVIDALRPQVQALWRNLPFEERRRFMRHIRPYWEVHRHRVAPAVAREIDALQRCGSLSVIAGRMVSLEVEHDRLTLLVRNRHGGETRGLGVEWLVNCSGPHLDYERVRDPLVRSLFASGLGRPDALKLGLDVTDDYRLIGRNGDAAESLFALGPPIRGALGEATAVPDIRKQCEALACYISQQHSWTTQPFAASDAAGQGQAGWY